MVTDRLIYTNSAGKSIEFSVDSVYHTSIRTDVEGLNGIKNTIYSEKVVGRDGEIKTGNHVNVRDIEINGFINNDEYNDNAESFRNLSTVFSPIYTGILRFEGEITAEIDVEVEEAPDPKKAVGERWPKYSISLVALNPNWRQTHEKSLDITDTGTEIYYSGSKPCGMEITITALADGVDIDNISVANGDDVKTITFRRGGGVYLDTDDEVILDTVPGQVNITLNGDTAYERLDRANSYFPFELYPGVNTVSWEATAPEYGAEETYALGNIVEYSGAFYECSTAIVTPEAWTAGHWTEITAADMIEVSISYTPLYLGV